MSIRVIQRLSTIFHLRTLPTARTVVFALLFVVSSFFQPFCFEATAQTGGEGKSQASGAGGISPGQSAAPIGNTGYLVPLPEIRMNRIIGDKPAPPVTPAPPTESPSVTPAPTKEPSPAEEVEPPPEERPAAPPEAPDVSRLPFEPVHRRPVVEQPPERARTQEAPEEESRTPLSHPPEVPEDTIDAPAPKKELLGKKTKPVIPPLLDLVPVKRASRTTPLESTKAQDKVDSKEEIPLDPRREPEAIPAAEPEAPTLKEPVNEVQEEAPKEVLPPPEPAPPPLAFPPLEPLPEPELKEPVPSALMPPAVDERTEAVPVLPPVEQPAAPESVLPPVEQPALPAKETLPSPLAPEALNSPEVMEYLRETAPLLEELSLLMTRAPSLSLADYDPSDADAPIVPKEIYLKIDSMKRELQNLDSKTFGIIPPRKYAPFHSVIRESITETYQACDAIISYLHEKNDENLQKIMEHLNKARELIRKTRSVQG